MQSMQKVLQCDGVSTKGLHVHLKSSHQIAVLLKRKNSETLQEDSQEKRPKITTIEQFVNDTTLPAVLARMTAYDGLPFKVFITYRPKEISDCPGLFFTKVINNYKRTCDQIWNECI